MLAITGTLSVTATPTSEPSPASASATEPVYCPLEPMPPPSVSVTDTEAPPASVPLLGLTAIHESEAVAVHATDPPPGW